MLLSPHFDLQEFLVSQTATRLNRHVIPNEIQVKNLTRLCIEVLEPLRIYLERPIIITSGLRPDWLNRAVGGSIASAHMGGYAADIIAPGMTPLALSGHAAFMDHIAQQNDLCKSSIDQIILEFGQWVHIGIAPETENPRHQLLTARHGKYGTEYNEGLTA